MQINMQNVPLTLEDIPLDEGYASEKVEATDIGGAKVIFGGQTGKTQIVFSAPYLDQTNLQEFEAIFNDKDFDQEQIEKYLIVATKEDIKVATDLPLLIDSDEAFGDYYGVRISDTALEGKLAKTLFVISKDGAIFYEEIPNEQTAAFDTQKLYQKTLAALNCYTGKGCH